MKPLNTSCFNNSGGSGGGSAEWAADIFADQAMSSISRYAAANTFDNLSAAVRHRVTALYVGDSLIAAE